MNNKESEYGYFVTDMPASRPADYYLGYDGGSVFIDFNNGENGCVYLVRISFDGYGCCNLKGEIKPLNMEDSMMLKEMMNSQELNQPVLDSIVKRTVRDNKALLWIDALREYQLL